MVQGKKHSFRILTLIEDCLKLRTSNPRSEKVKQMSSLLTVNGSVHRILPSLPLFSFCRIKFYSIQGSKESKYGQYWKKKERKKKKNNPLNLFLENNQGSLQSPRPAAVQNNHGQTAVSWETGSLPVHTKTHAPSRSRWSQSGTYGTHVRT